jgi:cytochrome d ubiquinol oxidase subunit I
MKIESGVSPNVTAGEVLFSLLAFTLLYGALMVADIYLLNKYAKAGLHGPAPEEHLPAAEPARA